MGNNRRHPGSSATPVDGNVLDPTRRANEATWTVAQHDLVDPVCGSLIHTHFEVC
jgi:hypothetical protein